MTVRGVTRAAGVAALAVGAMCLSGCSPTEYHGSDSEIDGVLWRQIAGFEDPMNFAQPTTRDASTYLAQLGGERWDGSTSTLPELSDGGIVLYDISTTGSVARFSVFISSGPRPDVPTDAGQDYAGPSQVYTCYGITADLGSAEPVVDRTIFDECPTGLVRQLPADAAFASGEVFDG